MTKAAPPGPPHDPAGGPVETESAIATATAAVMRPVRRFVAFVRPTDPPLELQIVGRTLWHAAAVGLGAGLVGCAFFAAVELLQGVLLEGVAGYEPLRAHGERIWTSSEPGTHLYLLLLIPAVGALLGGLLTRWAPECRGGGGDATIEAFHHRDGVIRRRVLWVKPLASILTLGSGGSGGREGPTMQIGGALGSTIGRLLAVTARERRVLMVAGVAAGISAVFRTPLGAALIAIEMLYKDDFETEALIPAVLASVISYSVAISVFGHAPLFGYLAPYTFRPEHIPLYLALALVIAIGGSIFVGSIRFTQRAVARLRIPEWLRPAVGGLALGGFVLVLIHYVGPLVGRGDTGMGLLGGGYGAAQIAITGASWLPAGWTGVQILLLLALAKILASSFTIGSGGSAGDFAPALAIGGLLGGAFGLAAQLVLDDPTLQPGAFALVGMGAFYGGIANTPLAALVLVCEMAGSYELLVPLMLVQGVSFIALRRVSLYPAQVRSLRDSPAHQREDDTLRRVRCCDAMRRDRTVHTVSPRTTIPELTALVDGAADQDVFPVVDEAGVLCGVVAAEALRIVASHPELHQVAVVADLMAKPASVRAEEELRVAAHLMISHDLRSLPVVSGSGEILGLLDEHDISSAMLEAMPRAPTAPTS